MAKYVIKGTPWYIHAIMIVSLLLIIAGFIVPPHGEISGSVLTAIGELVGGGSLITFVINIPTYLEAGVKAQFRHGGTTVTVAADEVKDSKLDE